MRALSLTAPIVVVSLLAVAIPSIPVFAVPPLPPPEFAQPQSPPKPEPFPVKLIDQGQYDPALKGYFLPEGFKLEIVIQEPETINPVGMTFAPDGTLFVMEWRPDPVTGDKWFEVKETLRYRDGSTRQVATMKKFTTDLIKQFKPNAVTGKFDAPKVIIAEELPSSILYHEGWLYVTGRGTVRRWRQGVQVGVGGPGTERPANPNDPWSIREIIAQGFCGFHHHQVSGLTIGNDGLLYITSGDDDNVVEGSDGSRATVLRTGAIFRCKPDGSNLEVYSMGYRNPYRDIVYDDKFNFFHSDNDNEDGSRFMGCRIMHVAEGTDFGWRLQVGARCCRPDNVRGAVAGELPGKVPPMIKTGRGAPAGLLMYNDTHIPEKYRGLLYYPDVFRKLIRAYKVAPDGATFKISNEFEFLKTEDPLFRPCQMIAGPDGAIYICDWRTNSGGAGKLSGDGVHGRIYRVSWVGNSESPALPLRGMDSWAKIQKLSDDKLVEALSLPDLTDRVEARKELVRRGAKARDLVIRKLISGGLDGDARIPALGVLLAGWNADVEDICRMLLNDSSPDVRRVAVEGLGQHAKTNDYRIAEAIVKALGDGEPSVRRAGALALGRIGGEGAPSTLVNLMQADREGDAFLRDGYLRALERLGKPGVEALLSLASSGDKERDFAIEAFLGLRSKQAVEALPELLARPDISTAQRVALVRSFANYQFDPPISLEPLVSYLAKRPNESLDVVRAAVEVFAVSGEANARRATDIVLGLVASQDDEVRYLAIKAIEELRLTAASPQLVPILSDPKRRESERAAAARALKVLGDKRAIAPILELLAGQHPATLKAEALQALAALDIATARTAAEKLLDQPDPMLLGEAVNVLATTKTGAKLIGERFVSNKLPRDFFPRVTEALKKFGDDPALAKLQAEALRGALLVSLEPGQIEKVRKLVVEKGDARKGRELYLNTKVLACSSCHRMEGIGGNVGPDLTRIWDTQSLDKLLESIVEPSKEIKEGFQTYRLATADGQIITGLKIKEDSKEVVIREANGRDTRVAKENVDSLSPTKLSLMPDNAVAQITYDQFIDLLAFLKSKKEQESLRGVVGELSVSGPFSVDLKIVKPEVTAAAKWKSITSEASGRLDFAALMVPNSAVYARAFVFSPKKQQASLTIQSESTMRVWLNDVSTFDRQVPGADGEATIPMELQQGWNVLLIKLPSGSKPPTLSLRLVGEGLRTSSNPDSSSTLPSAAAGSN